MLATSALTLPAALPILSPAALAGSPWNGRNGYGLWGPPPEGVGPVVVVWEYQPPDAFFSGCKKSARITAPVAHEESDRATVYVCTAPLGGWHAAWPRLVHLSS